MVKLLIMSVLLFCVVSGIALAKQKNTNVFYKLKKIKS